MRASSHREMMDRSCAQLAFGPGGFLLAVAMLACGSASAPRTEAGPHVGPATPPPAANICRECTPEPDSTICQRTGKNCGPFTTADNCWATRTVNCGKCSLGTCDGPNNNVCWISKSTCESDAELCSRFGQSCGSLANVVDNCGANRASVSCGSACTCSDERDNDGDGFTDWPNDFACTGPNDSESGVTGQIKNGWTVLKPSADSRIVYVSDSGGSDSYDGLSTAAPKKTISAGKALLRTGYPDWLLLKRGDTFTDQSLQITISGRSPTEPIVVSSYGPLTGTNEDRPLLSGRGARTDNAQYVVIAHIASVLPVPANYASSLVISGGSDVLFEGGSYQGGTGAGFSSSSAPANLCLRRNVFYENDGHPVYGHADTYYIDGNVLYRPVNATPSGLKHGMYLGRADADHVTVRGNLIWLDPTETSGNGIMMRPGGVARGNIIVGSSLWGIVFGYCNDSDGNPPCIGTSGIVVADGNAVMDTGPINAGIEVRHAYVQPKSEVINNIIMRLTAGSTHYVSIVSGTDGSTTFGNTMIDSPLSLHSGAGMHVSQNTFYASQAGVSMISSSCSASTCANLSASGNRFNPLNDSSAAYLKSVQCAASQAECDLTTTAATLANPDCSLATYLATLGIKDTIQGFYQRAAVNHSRYHFDPRYTSQAVMDYLRSCVAH